MYVTRLYDFALDLLCMQVQYPQIFTYVLCLASEYHPTKYFLLECRKNVCRSQSKEEDYSAFTSEWSIGLMTCAGQLGSYDPAAMVREIDSIATPSSTVRLGVAVLSQS